MEITFSEIRDKEIVNICDGKKLGHASDICFDKTTGVVLGVIVPAERRIFRRAEDIFIPIENVKRIGEDVVLVKLEVGESNPSKFVQANSKNNQNVRVYTKYKRACEKEK